MKVALLVAGQAQGRALGTAVLRRVERLREARHEPQVTLASGADLEWFGRRGVVARARSYRELLLEEPAGKSDAVWVVAGAYDPLVECMRLWKDRARVLEVVGSLERAEELEGVATVRATGNRQPPAGNRQSARRPGGAPGVALVAVGRPAAHKRLEVIVEALARVRRARDARLAVVGRVDDAEAVAARDAAMGWARALGVERHVEFVGYRDDPFAGADVVVCAHDGFVEHEARALGCRVVKSTDAATIAQTILSGTSTAAPLEEPEPSVDALLATRSSTHVSLVPLLEHLENERIDYADRSRWPGVSWLRWKVMRHLHKFYALALEHHVRDRTRASARALRSLERDLALLEQRAR